VTAAVRLALADLRTRGALAAGAILLVAVPLTGFLLLDGFGRGIDLQFGADSSRDLIVQESNSVGEVYGSRIPAAVETELLARGVRYAIPEIHTVAGTASDNAVLLRGVDPARYRAVTDTILESGRMLAPGDPPSAVIVGTDLAASRGVGPGDLLPIRGRPFEVIGVFAVGTYVDNEAWVSLAAAQGVLGWGGDVSVFVVPGDGPLQPGDRLPGPLSVARRGDFADITSEWDPILALTRVAAGTLAAAGAIILAAVLWRFAWLRRRELAILRSLGMSRRVGTVFLLTEGTVIVGTALVAAVAAALLLGEITPIKSFGIRAEAVFDTVVILRAAGVAAAVMAASLAVAAVRVHLARPAELLRRD
jgi:ABC-type lipoprotein release transport system permease subunit